MTKSINVTVSVNGLSRLPTCPATTSTSPHATSVSGSWRLSRNDDSVAPEAARRPNLLSGCVRGVRAGGTSSAGPWTSHRATAVHQRSLHCAEGAVACDTIRVMQDDFVWHFCVQLGSSGKGGRVAAAVVVRTGRLWMLHTFPLPFLRSGCLHGCITMWRSPAARPGPLPLLPTLPVAGSEPGVGAAGAARVRWRRHCAMGDSRYDLHNIRGHWHLLVGVAARALARGVEANAGVAQE